MTHRSAPMHQLRDWLDDEPPEVIQQVFSSDGMQRVLPDLYFTAGREALRSIRLAMLAAKPTHVDRILDFANGSGRVLRYLKAAFPEAELTACDVLEEDLAFCSEVFGATTVKSNTRPADVELDAPFDLIWCGSLLSHTDSEDFFRVLGLFNLVLAPGGVAVFTTMGRGVVRALREGFSPLSLTQQEARQLLREYDEAGFAFTYGVHDPKAKLGEAVASPAWVCGRLDELPELRLVLYQEESWLGQDVIACTKIRRR